jgi:hypothetical protein
MTNADMVEALTRAAQRLISASIQADVEGIDVVKEAGYDPNEPGLYDAFWEIKRRGDLDMHFPGGTELPYMVRLP